MTSIVKIVLIVGLILSLSEAVVQFYDFRNQAAMQVQKQPPAPQQNIVNRKPDQPSTPDFSPLKTTQTPSFIKEVKNTSDVKIDFHYEGDYISPSEWRTPEFYTPEGSSEKFLSLTKVRNKKNQYGYGPKYLSIFKSEEGHSYQGTPIYLLNPDSKYSASYIGFLINKRDLIGELKVEFGIDYLSDEQTVDKSKPSILASLFDVESAYACGPGLYLRRVGSSNLIFIEESNGIAWYRLEKPVDLYNLDLNYCTDPPEPKPSYCNNEAEDPSECWKYCYYNHSISNLKNGNLKMHVLYKPNDKEGFLELQMINLLLTDSAGAYYQPIMRQNFDHYYRAYLH